MNKIDINKNFQIVIILWHLIWNCVFSLSVLWGKVNIENFIKCLIYQYNKPILCVQCKCSRLSFIHNNCNIRSIWIASHYLSRIICFRPVDMTVHRVKCYTNRINCCDNSFQQHRMIDGIRKPEIANCKHKHFYWTKLNIRRI